MRMKGDPAAVGRERGSEIFVVAGDDDRWCRRAARFLVDVDYSVIHWQRAVGHSIAIENVRDSPAVGAPERKFRAFEYFVHRAAACRKGGDGFVTDEMRPVD